MDLLQRTVLENLDAGERERLERIKRQWAYYHGAADAPLIVPAGGVDDNVILDLPREIVDTGISFLFGQDIDIQPSEELDPAAGEWLDETLEGLSPGGEGLLWQKLAMNGGVTGTTHAKISQREDGSWRVTPLDPSYVVACWAPNDIEDIHKYTITWTAIKDEKPVVCRQMIERADNKLSWTITDQESVGRQWRTIGTALWPWPFSNIVGCQNLPCPNEYYGVADLEDSVLSLCDAINRVASHIAKIVRVHGFPKPWAKGMGSQQLEQVDMGMQTIALLPGDNAELGYLETRGDIKASLEMYDRLKRALLEQARIPEVATGAVGNVSQLSGVALQVMYAPLVQKTETKRRTYGAMIEDLCARLLVLGGQAPDLASACCDIQWPQIVPSDPMSEAQTLAEHKALGIVSQETIASKLGYDYFEEKERMDAEAAGVLDDGNDDPPIPPLSVVPGPTMGPDAPRSA